MMRRRSLSLALAAVLSIGAGSTVAAGERFVGAGAGYDGGVGGYGFAGPAIDGAYVGAPLTRFPRPQALVPPAWGYGTYGVPTVTGIRQAPSAQPVVYVLDDGGGRRRPARARPRVQSRDDGRWIEPGPRDRSQADGPNVVTLPLR